MNTVGLLVVLEAKAGKEDDLASFLTGALPLVQQEPKRQHGSLPRSDRPGSRSLTRSPTTTDGTPTSPTRLPQP